MQDMIIDYEDFIVFINADSNSARSILQLSLQCMISNLTFIWHNYVGGKWKVMKEKFSAGDYFLINFLVASDNIVR